MRIIYSSAFVLGLASPVRKQINRKAADWRNKTVFPSWLERCALYLHVF
ncbi:hypothetical protein E2C01_042239 [Portunus trituberculatus]|uniref:Uncharacterized protein n=1 Tax=Portunus trituberculatus TaxID=210409 RepID=A0A5B7FSJ2_PORTR|nr:hypothetical protein [Portunus trituberculatus]